VDLIRAILSRLSARHKKNAGEGKGRGLAGWRSPRLDAMKTGGTLRPARRNSSI
jgi:hypothetical protein